MLQSHNKKYSPNCPRSVLSPVDSSSSSCYHLPTYDAQHIPIKKARSFPPGLVCQSMPTDWCTGNYTHRTRLYTPPHLLLPVSVQGIYIYIYTFEFPNLGVETPVKLCDNPEKNLPSGCCGKVYSMGRLECPSPCDGSSHRPFFFFFFP